YQGVSACRYAISSPHSKIGEPLNNYQTSITGYKEKKKSTQKTGHQNDYFTDRRYYRSEQNSRHSWKHTNDKREAAKLKLRDSPKDKLNSRHIENDRFHKRYRHYVECEGEDVIDNDGIESFENVFNALKVEIQNQLKEREYDDMETFFTSFSEINF
ncbi:hypothetical protein GcM1_198012, partial [Golovinomyces cichoracearum]